MPYVAITCLGAFIAFILFQAYRRRLDVLSMPFIAACMFAYLYVISPLKLLAQGDVFRYVNAAEIAKGVWVPLVMLVALYGGWAVCMARQSGRRTEPRRPEVDARRLCRGGLLLSLFGGGLWLSFVMFSGGFYNFYSKVHGSGGDWQGTTAYQYGGICYVYAGLVLMIAGACKLERPSRRLWVGIAGLSTLVLFHAFLMGSRGTTFRLVGATGAAFMLARRRRVPVTFVMAAGAALGLVLLSLPVLRTYTPLGQWHQLGEVDLREAADPALRAGTGNEFVLHTGVIETVDRTGKLGLGEVYVWYHLIHPIPRLLWPSKPYGFHTGTITHNDMRSVVGWVPGTGSASGNVACWYREWGIFSLLAWAALGYLTAAAYSAATAGEVWWILVYSLIVSGTCNFMAQGFGAFWESFLLQVFLCYVLWRLYIARSPVVSASRPAPHWCKRCLQE